jgi:hypothetical protein
MDNLARNLHGGGAVQEVGSVLSGAEGELSVRTDSGDYRARRAHSCLVDPVAGDFVLVATLGDGRCFVLAVLEREAPGVTLAIDGDLDVQLRSGSFKVAAQQGVSIASADDVSVVSGRIDVNAVEGSVVVQRATFLGRYFKSEIEKVKSFAGTVDAVMDRFSQKVKRSYRTVEEVEQLRAHRIDHRAETLMNLRGKNTLMTAENLVKVDGEQIHLG